MWKVKASDEQRAPAEAVCQRLRDMNTVTNLQCYTGVLITALVTVFLA